MKQLDRKKRKIKRAKRDWRDDYCVMQFSPEVQARMKLAAEDEHEWRMLMAELTKILLSPAKR